MSQSPPGQQQTISIEAKELVKTTFDKFKAKPESIIQEDRNFIQKILDQFWLLVKDQSKTYEERASGYDFIEMCHAILNRKYDPVWKENLKKYSSPGGKGKPAFIASPEQRAKNCDEFMKYIKSKGELREPELINALAVVWGGVKA